MSNINVKDYLPNFEENIFIKEKPINTAAASYRYSVVEKVLEEWFDEVNSERANTRDMPGDLVELYEEACRTMLKIRMRERDIVLGANK